MSKLLPWIALFGLGAYHGVNPAMGWLFAVALGLQEKSWRAVVRALPPIALGHAISIGIVAGIVWLAEVSVPGRPLRYGAAALLVGFGLFRLIRARHPSWVGLRVGFRDLVLWSFLMASAHGAGLMLVPVLVGMAPDHPAHAMSADSMQMDMTADPQANMGMDHASHLASIGALDNSGPLLPLAAVVVHTAAMLAVSAAIAILVYERLGVAILRRAWLNLDLIWVISLVAAGLFVLLV